jgi:hypothetical protein
MRKIVFTASAIALFFVISACSKSDNKVSDARTVDNLSGSYTIVSLTGSAGGITINLYDSLDPCERDNVIQLDTNLIAQFLDAGVACAPPSDSTGTWSLSANTDTIYIASGASYIKSWDGKTLVTTNSVTVSGFPAVATTTLQKK